MTQPGSAPHGSDVCFCGDWRSDHQPECKLCKYHPIPGPCEAFRWGRPATKEERAHWEKYNGVVAR